MSLSEEVKSRVVDYVLKHGDSLEFTKCFWKECEPLPNDIVQFERFVKAIRLISRGVSGAETSRQLGVNPNSVNSWRHLKQIPKLGHFLRAYIGLGGPANQRVWLTLEQSHGHAIPIGQFVQVPETVENWDDVEKVIDQISPSNSPSSRFSKAYLFGFLVGMIVGDAHKPKQGRGHRHIDLVLSMKYETNIKIGEFTSFCANQFGLRMDRHKDKPKPANKPNGFYEWISQSSQLIDWIFNVVLGLRDGQHTTYDQIKMDWALAAPRDFRLGLLQGIAESDGSVNVASQTVEFWVIPDWEFMIALLGTFGLRGFRNREAVSMVKSQAIASFGVPVFAPHLCTVRYQRLQLMATTPKLEREDRIPVPIRSEITRLAGLGFSVPRIVEEVARSQGLLVSFEAAQRWARKSAAISPGVEAHDRTEE